MLFKAAVGVACLLQFLGPATALPSEQHPLAIHGSKNVQTVRAELIKAEIIPTVTDDFLPSLTLSVAWPKKHARLGNTIKPKLLQHQPRVTLHDEIGGKADREMSYVITLTDPDAPSRNNPKWSEMCHWIAANVSLSHSPSHRHDNRPDDVMPYKPPGPPPKTGKHRYVFLVFAPRNGTVEPLRLDKLKERRHWGTGEERGGVRSWAEVNGLVAVGAEFVYAENGKQ